MGLRCRYRWGSANADGDLFARKSHYEDRFTRAYWVLGDLVALGSDPVGVLRREDAALLLSLVEVANTFAW